jgi:hypothetical protein
MEAKHWLDGNDASPNTSCIMFIVKVRLTYFNSAQPNWLVLLEIIQRTVDFHKSPSCLYRINAQLHCARAFVHSSP